MACQSIGFWAYSDASSDICNNDLTIELFSDGGVYTPTTIIGSGCPESDYAVASGFYSNGSVVLFVEVNGLGKSEVISSTPCPTSCFKAAYINVSESPEPIFWTDCCGDFKNAIVPPLTNYEILCLDTGYTYSDGIIIESPCDQPCPTATPTPTPTSTPTPTPTPSPTPLGDYCIYNTITYDGNYILSGTYGSYNYYSNPPANTGFIFYSTSENRWCLASNLGDPCVQFGAYNSLSSSPDLDDTVMYPGICITTTTTTDPCASLDIDAIFDCYIPPTPSSTPTPTPTPTLTPTPTPTDPCGGRFVVANGIVVSSTPTPTPTPTPSPTPVITRPCNFSGEVIFNSINEIIQCSNSKKFKDCFTGMDYYTSEAIYLSGTTNTPKEGYVYNAIINGQGYCVIFEGLVENISGVDNVTLTTELGPSNEGACLLCIANLTPTPTPTPTTTPTPTPSSTPCISYQYTLTNNAPTKLGFQYTDCKEGPKSITVPRNSSVIICSSTTPTCNNPQNGEITQTGFIC